MARLPSDTMNEIVRRHAFLEAEMARGGDRESFARIASEYAGLEAIVAAIGRLRALDAELADAAALAEDPSADREMRELASGEVEALKQRLAALSGEIRLLLLPKDSADEKSAILEIRAGTGGSEAGLFAGDLFRMYQRYAEVKGWKVELLSASEGEVRRLQGGRRIRERARRLLAAEVRVRRPPGAARARDGIGRAHPHLGRDRRRPAEAEEIDIDIRAEDIRIDTMRASGLRRPARQHHRFGRAHHPSADRHHGGLGREVAHQNRARAMQVLRARLFDLERSRADEARSEARRSQVGSGDRSERIRTYTSRRGASPTTRINLTLYKLDRIIEGDLDELVDALTADHQAALLAAVGGED